jgi:hypothetical protein
VTAADHAISKLRLALIAAAALHLSLLLRCGLLLLLQARPGQLLGGARLPAVSQRQAAVVCIQVSDCLTSDNNQYLSF